MIEVKIGDEDVTKNVWNYSLNFIPEYGSNSFKCTNGDSVTDFKGNRVSLSFNLRNIPTERAAKISAILNREEFDCTFAAPAETTTRFKSMGFTCDPKDTGRLWDYSIKLESTSLLSAGDSL